MIPSGGSIGNTVIINGGTITKNAYGAVASDSLPASENRLIMHDGSVVYLVGAYVAAGNAENNTVLVDGGIITGSVFGAEITTSGQALHNSVVISEGAITGNIYGAQTNSGNAIGNTVTLTGGSANWILGAYSTTGTVIGNKTHITGGHVNGVSGAETASGNAFRNSVYFNNATTDDINGGFIGEGLGDAAGNTVTVDGGSVTWVITGGFVADNGSGNATGNTVVINGGELGSGNNISTTGAIQGGRASTGDASNNTVVINGGTVRAVTGGRSDGNYDENTSKYVNGGDVTGNRVLITGGSILSQVNGGGCNNGTASGNVVEIRGGSFGKNASIMGGRADWGTKAINNTVILGGNLDLSSNEVYGGFDAYEEDTEVTFGNTLVLDDVRATVGKVSNFENYSVRLTSWTGDGKAMLTVQSVSPTQQTDLSNTNFSLSVPYLAAKGALPSVGDRLALICNTEAKLKTENMTVTTPSLSGVKRGVAYFYDLAVEVKKTSIDAVITGKRLNPQTKSLSEGRVASLAMNNRGGDLVAGSALGRAAMAAMRSSAPSGMEAFFAMSAGHARHDTGSHVDVDGLSTLAGVSSSLLKDRSLVLGGFVENGWGRYTAANGFADAPSVRAKGDASYCGGGLLGIYDLANCGLRGFSVNGALRAGRQDADYSSGDLTDGAGNTARYNISSPYFGAHVGVSHACNVSRKIGVESYTRFLWTRLYGDHANVCGDDIRFRSVDSQRIQTGARFHYEATPTVRPFAGASYEWECGGTARATTHGDGITAPSLRGGTGVGELGVLFQPIAGKAMFIEAGMNGYVGKREGFGGNVRFTIDF